MFTIHLYMGGRLPSNTLLLEVSDTYLQSHRKKQVFYTGCNFTLPVSLHFHK